MKWGGLLARTVQGTSTEVNVFNAGASQRRFSRVCLAFPLEEPRFPLMAPGYIAHIVSNGSLPAHRGALKMLVECVLLPESDVDPRSGQPVWRCGRASIVALHNTPEDPRAAFNGPMSPSEVRMGFIRAVVEYLEAQRLAGVGVDDVEMGGTYESLQSQDSLEDTQEATTPGPHKLHRTHHRSIHRVNQLDPMSATAAEVEMVVDVAMKRLEWIPVGSGAEIKELFLKWDHCGNEYPSVVLLPNFGRWCTRNKLPVEQISTSVLEGVLTFKLPLFTWDVCSVEQDKLNEPPRAAMGYGYFPGKFRGLPLSWRASSRVWSWRCTIFGKHTVNLRKAVTSLSDQEARLLPRIFQGCQVPQVAPGDLKLPSSLLPPSLGSILKDTFKVTVIKAGAAVTREQITPARNRMARASIFARPTVAPINHSPAPSRAPREHYVVV